MPKRLTGNGQAVQTLSRADAYLYLLAFPVLHFLLHGNYRLSFSLYLELLGPGCGQRQGGRGNLHGGPVAVP